MNRTIGLARAPSGGAVCVTGAEADVREVLELLRHARLVVHGDGDPLREAAEGNVACLRAWERLEAAGEPH